MAKYTLDGVTYDIPDADMDKLLEEFEEDDAFQQAMENYIADMIDKQAEAGVENEQTAQINQLTQQAKANGTDRADKGEVKKRKPATPNPAKVGFMNALARLLTEHSDELGIKNVRIVGTGAQKVDFTFEDKRTTLTLTKHKENDTP